MSFKHWQVIVVVFLLLVGFAFVTDLIRFVPGYSALREVYPYYVGNSYRSLVEVLAVLLLASVLLRKSGQSVLETLGIGSAPWNGLKAAALMVLPLYLVFAFAFSIADMVPMEVLYLAVISPFAEELAYRGFAFGLLRKVAGWGFWRAALLPAAFFAWDHIDQANDISGIVMTILLTGGFAILVAWLFEKWGGLWVPLGLHISMNFAWNLFAVGDGAFAGTLPTIMQLTTVIVAILGTIYRGHLPFLRTVKRASALNQT